MLTTPNYLVSLASPDPDMAATALQDLLMEVPVRVRQVISKNMSHISVATLELMRERDEAAGVARETCSPNDVCLARSLRKHVCQAAQVDRHRAFQ